VTLKDERTRALIQTRAFLVELLYPHHTPRVPKSIRERARSLLKHYPGALDLYRISLGEELLDVDEVEKEIKKSDGRI
jgi:hypothetical protein